MTLYEMSDELLEILDEEEVTEETESRLAALLPTMEAKVENICRLIRELDAQTAPRRAEAERLMALVRAGESRQRWLKDYLQRCLDHAGLKRFDTELFKVRIQANSQPTVIYDGDVSDLPPGLRRVTIEADKRAALEVLKAGGELPEGFRVETGKHLRIQ